MSVLLCGAPPLFLGHHSSAGDIRFLDVTVNHSLRSEILLLRKNPSQPQALWSPDAAALASISEWLFVVAKRPQASPASTRWCCWIRNWSQLLLIITIFFVQKIAQKFYGNGIIISLKEISRPNLTLSTESPLKGCVPASVASQQSSAALNSLFFGR